MAVPAIQNSFVSGEISPSILGRQDLARYHTAATTMRNMFPSYRGPAYSRPGTLFCGFSKQTGRDYPPRLIPFQFSASQGLALEFGHQYMRVVFDGAFVTEGPVGITGVTSATPPFISVTSSSATAISAINNGGVLTSYAPSDTITLAGGSFTIATEIGVTSVNVLSASPSAHGTGYVPGDTITAAGGVGTEPIFMVAATQVVSATIASAGTGGTPGAAVVTGTTGVGTKFQAAVTISAGGVIAVVNSITLGGAYTTNPTVLTAEPVTGGGLTGAQLNIHMGVEATTVSTAGALTSRPTSDLFTQASTSGSGTGATVVGTLFGVAAASILTPGIYSATPTNPVAQASSSGAGTGVTFNMTYSASGTSPTYADGDWVFITGVVGPTGINGQTVIVGGTSNTGFFAYDVYGNPINLTGAPAYVSGGTTARIYTLPTQYNEQDLVWMKFQQSADVMSICCVNQDTSVEYPPLDLSRVTDTDWVFSDVVPQPTVDPPASLTGVASTTGSVDYQYIVTAVSAFDGTESVGSPIANITGAVDIANTQGTITLSWPAVDNALAYYLYKASPSYSGQPPIGATFGFAGQALGLSFKDSNIVQDFAQTPPTHQNPFARGAVIKVTTTSGGTGYTHAAATMNTVTGSGAVLTGVIDDSGAVAGWIIDSPGQDYSPGDTATVTGDGSGATVLITLGPQSGTYPSTISYFQERRAYANSLNNPDTYWMSQPGSFTNFDVRSPPIASDAIAGSPWAVQVNGIQWLLQTSGGLLVMTGLSAWLLAGVGSFATNVQPISPSNQDDVPQAFSGCSPLLMPLKINYDVIYLNWNSQFYYDLPYQLYALSEPIDLTEISSHLFINNTIISHAWCEQPDKLLWAVRNDGIMLSLTYYKTQQISGWARHDTNGAFVTNCSVKEPPIDALYVGTQRFTGTSQECYMIERMAARTWRTTEEVWCVDCALELPQPTPNATLSMSSPFGSGQIIATHDLVGGSGYSSATQFSIVDTNFGVGSGATLTGTIVGGVVTSLTITAQGGGYSQPMIDVFDPAGSLGGSGFSATAEIDNVSVFSTDAPIFSSGDVNSFIRAGGGVAVITNFIDSQNVTVNVLNPFPAVPNASGIGKTFPPGQWTLTTPVTTVGGLYHLAGQQVTGVADGIVIGVTTVAADGTITLPTGRSAVIVGLRYTAQLQSVPLDLGQPTVQGQRKEIQAITARLEASLGAEAAANRTDGSLLSPPQEEVNWEDLTLLPDSGSGAPPYGLKPYNSKFQPLVTGDRRVVVSGGLSRQGQIALEQPFPLPMNVLALIPEVVPGDTPQMEWPKQQQRARR